LRPRASAAGLLFLGLAAVVDLAIAALLIGVSGFFFGFGPESLGGGLGLEIAYMAAVIACVVAPATGFILNGAGKRRAAQIVAWLPALVALIVLATPVLAGR
jgi:hypothetical protein